MWSVLASIFGKLFSFLIMHIIVIDNNSSSPSPSCYHHHHHHHCYFSCCLANISFLPSGDVVRASVVVGTESKEND